jgi:hypothetical protein
MRINQQTLAKSSIKGKHVTQRTSVKCGRKMIPMISQCTKMSRSRQWPNVAKNNYAPRWRTLSHCGLWPNVAQNVPLVRGLCHAADFDQMWPKLCPLFEDFVLQWTLTKCGPKCAPHQRSLSRSGLWPNVARNVPLIGGHCHAADFDQMWPKICPLLEDFVTQQTLTKCGPKCAPRRRTLSRSGLQPNVVQTCAFWQVTLFCYGVQPHMDQQCSHRQKKGPYLANRF